MFPAFIFKGKQYVNMIERLLIVQQHDCRIRDLQKELRDIPKRKAEELLRLKNHKEALAKAEENLKSRQADIKKFELEGEARKEKIAKLRNQQLEIKTNKEFKTIEGEIKIVQDDLKKVEDQQLAVMEAVELAKAEVQSRKSALLEEEKVVQKDVDLHESRLSQINNEMKAANDERMVSAGEMDPKWLAQYERIFKRKDKALVQIEEGVCGGCHMTLPPYIIHGAKRMNSMVVCDFCGRMLY